MQRVLGTLALGAALGAGLFAAFIPGWANGQVTQLEDAVEPLQPKQKRTEAERDRIEASALFATARALEQKGDTSGALRTYQRAYRYDPSGEAILSEIIPLAFSLGRESEAVRYAVIAVEKSPTDAVLLRRMALHLTEQDDWKRALHLYELWLKHTPGEANPADMVLVRMEMGRLYFLTENFPKAAESFGVVGEALEDPEKFGLDKELRTTLLGDGALTYQLFGECFFVADRLDEAAAAYEKSNTIKANRGLHGFNMARIHAKRKQPVEALDQLENYFQDKLANEGVAPYELLVQLLGDLNQEDSADEKLLALRANDPNNLPLGVFMAGRLLKAGKFDEAEAIYQKFVGNPRPTLEVYRGLIDVYLGSNKLEPLVEMLGQGVNKAGGLAPFNSQVATLLQDEKRLTKMLEIVRGKRMKEGFKPAPGEALAMAELALQAGKFDEAEEFFAWAKQDEPEAQGELLLSWGVKLFVADRSAAAAKAFGEAIDGKHVPEDNAAPYFYLAGALEMDGKTDEALAAAQKAVAIEPDSAQFAARSCWILYHAKRYDDAKAAYRALIDKFDGKFESSETRDAVREARSVLSNIHVITDAIPAAEELLEEILDEFPENAGALNDLGYLWADQNKRLERALRMIQTALVAEPNNSAYQDSLGWVLYRLGRFDEAVPALEKAAKGPDDAVDGVVLDHLGDAYAADGDAAKAKDAWTRAVDAFERDQEPDKAAQTKAKIK